MKEKMIYIILFAVIGLLLFRMFLNKRKNDKRYVFEEIKKKYSPFVAKIALAMYILESGWFKANIYKNTFGAGAIAVKNDYPYGFNKKIFKNVNTCGLYHSKNGFKYIKFCTLLDGFTFLANYLTVNGFDKENVLKRCQRWGSVDGYLEKVIKIYNNLKISEL